MSDGPTRLPYLGPDNRDRSVAILRAALGSVPVAGAVLSELITNLVPNQRMDRLEKYLAELGRRLDEIAEPDSLRQMFQDATNVAMIEDGAYQAARALTEERILRIVNCVVNGVTSDDVDGLLKRRLLLTLAELDDQHIAILHAHASRSYRAVDKLRPRQVASLGTPATSKQAGDMTLWLSGIGKLLQMGLLDFKPKLKAIDNLHPVPQYDNQGRPEGFYQITIFGTKLLISAGLLSET